MTVGRARIIEEISALLQAYNGAGAALSAETDIAAELNVDSVAVMDLLMLLEDKYDITIPINLLSDLRTIGDLAGTVESVMDEAGKGGCE